MLLTAKTAKNASPNLKATLRLIPSEVHSEGAIRSIPINKRKCRFQDETQGLVTLFSYYTQAACRFECFLKKAAEICRSVNSCRPCQRKLEPMSNFH